MASTFMGSSVTILLASFRQSRNINRTPRFYISCEGFIITILIIIKNTNRIRLFVGWPSNLDFYLFNFKIFSIFI